jgi:colanic acid biosynthesis glycosyl transferase WcaI
MAEWLSEKRHEIRVITAIPYYPKWKIFDDFKNRYSNSFENKINIIRCPIYIPSNLNSIKRIIHLLSFSISSFLPLLKSVFFKPDIIIQISPTLFCSPQTILVSKLSGAKSLLHIQDFEVDAMFGLSMAKNKFTQKIALLIERKILNMFSRISTISEGMIDKAISKGVDSKRLILFPNWSEINKFRDIQKDNQILINMGIEPTKKIILYSGNLGEKQGLENVLYAAKDLEKNNNIFFIIIGDGAAKKNLIKLAKLLKLENLKFLPLQPFKNLPKILACADCHLIIQKIGIADAVLPSKLTNIFAVGGNSVITADKGTFLGNLCEKYEGISTLVKPECLDDLKKGILETIEIKKPNVTATKYAERYLDKEIILENFEQKLNFLQKTL